MEFYWIGSCRCITETDHLFEPTNRKTLAPATWKTTDLLFLLGKVDVGAKIKSEYPRSGRSLSRPEHIQYVLETESYLNRILKSMNQRDWSSFESTTVKPVYNLMGPEHIQYVLEKEPYWIGFSIQNRWINVNRSTNLWILWTDNPMVKTF